MLDLAYPTFKLFVPRQAVGANLIYFDIWNPTGSGIKALVWSISPVVSTAVAVTAALGIDLFVQRTTAIGTGGTAATYNGTSQTAMTMSSIIGGGTSPASISGRLTPTGGATAGAVMGWISLQGEESLQQSEVEIWRHGQVDIPPLEIPENTGLSVVQGSVAGVGNIGFDIIFQTRPRA